MLPGLIFLKIMINELVVSCL